jgi:hypothetical protein
LIIWDALAIKFAMAMLLLTSNNSVTVIMAKALSLLSLPATLCSILDLTLLLFKKVVVVQ